MAEAEFEDWPSEKAKAPPKRRRHLRLYLPSSYSVQRCLILSVTGCALFGAVLGDIWLWRLLYG